MAEKKKQQKAKAQKEKVVRYTPNINLLRNINAIFLVAGFGVSLLTVFLLSARSPMNDVRSRGQEIAAPTLTPIPTLCPDACPTPSLSPTP